ncbi:hypothetical protein VOLCADRAFT_105724 [Volvox carteri f. nagariensis]|uniref:IPO4/5-like TPR repeats domain-containing protein n=1 Tax=Volvox carteri f. nagariensis TaxID=3068 RepID=D8U2M4_VOLCA|nr:uncharacterized protein VOLCADRAFT_105724 [Volvox carteri f. nagariensis]EFJ46086.1 hypothetical protein VOLCADRAFT_105724 [Volvox carteri f. nagariensis]|eukprot:XP_002952836.1 hypothetical protein VOLCADRAFT_105724 [Volvox carteri f. nagariensis]
MSAAQIQVLLSNAESFAGLISQTLSQDNSTRRTAEDLYGQLKQQRPDACASNLLQLLRTSGDARVRSTCAVYLRKFFKPSRKEAGWEQLNRSTKTAVKRELLAGLGSEQDRPAAKQTADAVVALGELLLEGADGGNKGWSDLVTSLQAWLNPHTAIPAVTREAALQVVAGLASELRQWSSQLAPVIVGCLGLQQEPDVQVAALKAVVEFLQALRKPRELRPYQAALPAALTALQHVLAAGQMSAAEAMLTELIRTAEREPGLWQPHITTAVPGMLALAGPGQGGNPLPDELRRPAAEFVLTLTDIKPQMVQSELGAGPLASQLVATVAHFLASGLQDDPAWAEDPMASPDMDEDESLGELHRYGLECALRAADQLDSAAMLGAVVDMTTAWARDNSDWRKRHAVLMCLSQVVGACKEVVGTAELASLAGLLVEALRDPHARVRWAACQTVGILSDDLGPGFQLQEGGGGSAVLRALTELLVEPDGPSCPQRVKAQACRAVVGFLEGLEEEDGKEDDEAEVEADQAAAAAAKAARVQAVLLPFLEPLSVPLLAQVERCAAGEGGAVAGGRALIPTPLQEFSLDVLTRLAVCLRVGRRGEAWNVGRQGQGRGEMEECVAKTAFTPCFAVAMPRVLAVLARAAPFHGPSAVAAGAVTEEEAAAIVRIQVGALECAAFMCRAAGPAAAAEHVPTLSAMLGLLCRPDIDSCSPLLEPLLGALEPLACCLGPEARHLLGPALPLLVQWAGKDVNLKVFDESESEGDDDDSEGSDRDDSDITILSYADVAYRCTGSVLLAKFTAVSALEELIDKMGTALAQQVTVVADALLPRLLEYYLDEVHAMARRALPKLLRNYLLAVGQGTLPAGDHMASPAAAQALLHRIWQAVTLVIHPEAAQSEAVAPLLRLPGGTQRPAPTTSTRADMVEVLTKIVDCVEGTMLQQSWVAEAFAALQVGWAAVAAAQQEAREEGSEDEEEEEDKSMNGDGSVDLEAEGSDADDDEDEDEDDGAETDDDSESHEQARERLRAQVESCVAAFTRKYGDAVASLAQQLLSGQQLEQQREAVVAVRNGMVA